MTSTFLRMSDDSEIVSIICSVFYSSCGRLTRSMRIRWCRLAIRAMLSSVRVMSCWMSIHDINVYGAFVCSCKFIRENVKVARRSKESEENCIHICVRETFVDVFDMKTKNVYLIEDCSNFSDVE